MLLTLEKVTKDYGLATKIKIRVGNQEVKESLIANGMDPLLAQLFAARGIKAIEEIDLNLSALPHVTELKNALQVGQRLAKAIANGEKIVIAADYDADGATACTVAMRGLRLFGAQVDYVIPSREKEGYGLSMPLIDRALTKKAALILTVDNGISAHEAVDYALSLGLEVIITDHHLPGETLPNCLIVNPNQPSCSFPSKNIAGVGVIFYVLLALRSVLRAQGNKKAECNLAHLLDFVAIGTVADVVKLDQVNRIFINHGLRLIRSQLSHPGVKALLKAGSRQEKDVSSRDLGFVIGPCINAAGRLEDISLSIKCLLSDEIEEAEYYADILNALNEKRRQTERQMLKNAENQINTMNLNQAIIVYSPDFHPGVIGVVAGRLKEKYHVPTLVFSCSEEGFLRGSGRSIPGLHLRDLLAHSKEILGDKIIAFGGHALAAGLTLQADVLDEFCEVFKREVMRAASEDIWDKTFVSDGSLLTKKAPLSLIKRLNREVWGEGFPEPRFSDVFTLLKQHPIGKRGEHSAAYLQKNGHTYKALFFYEQQQLPPQFLLLYRPKIRIWQGKEELQLEVIYWEEILDHKG